MEASVKACDSRTILDLMDRVATRTMNMDFTWDWPCGVAFYGICKAWEKTGNPAYVDFLVKWVEEYLAIGLPAFNVNAISMGHTMITLYQATGDVKYLDIAKKKALYLSRDAVRFGERVFQHTVSSNNDFPEQAWADTLFMAAFFLLRMGRLTDNEEYVKDGLNQYYWHEELLQDSKTNLYYHGWDNVAGNHMSGMFWARGNAWAAITMAEALRLVTYINPMFMRIDGSLRDQLSALVRLQAENGLWHTILDDPTSYCETSASAGIAASLSLYGHPLQRKYVERAYNGISSQIAEDGSVMNVSAGTAVMKTAEDYKAVPHKRVQGWGQGLTLAFLASLLPEKSDARLAQ